ncbi:hypothetical protein [Micromonospora zhanjiangensis]|uniref:Uncharacterized protein n=1 Tax=Micromonospora zhanjiangensis TaxID=1522057 RepID=A0ABV8KU74_9ACTN
MTDLYQPDGDERDTARRAAEAHTAASRDVEVFLRRLPAVPTAGDVAEYAALVAREEVLRAQRQAAVRTAGLDVPSVEPQ